MASKTAIIGQTGVIHYGSKSWVYDEWHPNLRGRLAMRVYREMQDNDAIIGGSLNAIKNTLRQVKWRAKAKDSSDKAKYWADFLDSVFADMDITWADFMSDAVSCVTFGYAPFEKVLKVRKGQMEDGDSKSDFDDGRIGIKGLFIRAQESLYDWGWDDDSNVTGMWQLVPGVQNAPVFIPVDKLLMLKTESNKGSPEGRSLLRNIYREWYFLKRIEELEAIGIERDLVGLPTMTFPLSVWEAHANPTSKNQDKQNIYNEGTKLLQQIKRNDHQGIGLPPEIDKDGKPTGYVFKLVTSGGQRQIDTNEVIKRKQKSIGINFSTTFQQLGVETHGSQSLSSDMTSQFALSLGALKNMIQEAVNRFVVAELMTLNAVPPEFWPEWIADDLEKQDIDKFAGTMSKLVDAGIITPDDDLERYAREVLEYPPKAEVEEGNEDTLPVDNPALAIQYLSLAIDRANAGGNVQLAAELGSKIADLLMMIPGASNSQTAVPVKVPAEHESKEPAPPAPDLKGLEEEAA